MFRSWCQRLASFLRSGRLLPFLPVVVGLTVFLLETEASGRAGGGQHYSGGSRSSGGSYGGSHSYSSGGSRGGGDGGAALFELIYWIFRLTFTHPLFMIPMWLVVGYVVYRRVQAFPGNATPREINELERRRLAPRQDVNQVLSNLQSRDPNFNVDAFFERTKKVFIDIQEAWFLRNLESVRVYMSDGLFRRFTTLLDLMALQNQRNGLADTKVISARILEVTTTEAFDCLTVRIHASLRDVDVPANFSDEQTRKAAQAATPQEFTELWTFVRRRDAQSKPGQDVAQGKCPNCGAPFTGGAANKCEYCGAIVNSGAYDWVLAEITQASEYLPHDPSTPGFAAMLAKDPDAAPEILRDRALLLFWKWLEAWARMDASRAQKLTTPDGLSSLVQEIEAARVRGDDVVVKLPAVGGTAIAAIETDVDGFDRVHVDIRWSAVMATKKTAGGKSPRPYRSVITMVRASAAQTDRGVGLANERCGNCRAPLTNSDSVICDFCGHNLANASKEWQLDRLVPYEQWRRPSTSRPATNANAFAVGSERRRLMQVMVAIVKADGVVDDSELKLLKQCSTRWRVPWNEVEELLASGDEASLLSDLRPESHDQARAFIQTLISAAKVDGRVDRRERMLIYRAGTKLNLEQAELDELIARS